MRRTLELDADVVSSGSSGVVAHPDRSVFDGYSLSTAALGKSSNAKDGAQGIPADGPAEERSAQSQN